MAIHRVGKLDDTGLPLYQGLTADIATMSAEVAMDGAVCRILDGTHPLYISDGGTWYLQ